MLVHLLHEGQVSVRDIEERVHLEKSKVSRAASRLVAAGHVDKRTDPRDRRLVALSLTEQGQTLMARLVPLALDFQRDIEQLLGPDLRGLERGLDRLSETVPGND